MSWGLILYAVILAVIFILAEIVRPEPKTEPPREIGDFKFPKLDGPLPVNHDPIAKGPNIVWYEAEVGQAKKREPPEDHPLDIANPWRFDG